MNLSVYNGVKDRQGIIVSYDTVVKRIQSGDRDLRERTVLANTLAITDKPAYNDLKIELPAVTFAGEFTKRRASELKRHSGLVCLDIDDCDVGSIMAELYQRNDYSLAFVSPSGRGVKLVCEVDPIPNETTHKHAWQACCEVFSDLPCEIDPSGSDVSRLCFLAYDPRVLVNADAQAIAWDMPEEDVRKPATDGADFHGDVDVSALDFISPDSSYDNWLTVGMGCHAAGVPYEVWNGWSAKGAKYNASEMPAKWESFKGHGITWGSVVALAQSNGYVLPQREIRRSVKLDKREITKGITTALSTCREYLEKVFSNKRIKFFGLRADTGVGKNESAIHFYMRGMKGLVNMPTSALAKEIEHRFEKAEIDTFRYRGVLSNPDGEFPFENPCIHAARYDAIVQRGWDAYKMLCDGCTVRDVCEQDGYRSQEDKANQAHVVLMPFPNLFLNPAFRKVAKSFTPSYSDLILQDEFDPYNAFIEVSVPLTRLETLRDEWDGYDISRFAERIIGFTNRKNPQWQAMRKWVTGWTKELPKGDQLRESREFRENVVKGLTHVVVDGEILHRDDAERWALDNGKHRDVDTIHTLPLLESDDWNLLVQMELFYSFYQNDVTAPIRYKDDVLTFMLPPLPRFMKARMGFMSATLDEDLFKRTFRTRQDKRGDVGFYDAGQTEWHADARVFQLRTNRNPRATVYQGEDTDGLLSRTGEYYWGLVKADLENPKRGVITYKALLAEKETELEGIPTANFGGLVGLDTEFRDVDVLHVLFSPEVPIDDLEWQAKTLYGADSVDIDAIHKHVVIGELIQAIGRARLVSRGAKVVVWCSHNIPGITEREQCVLFDEFDWERAGCVDSLENTVREREQAERDGDVKAIAETQGVSERTAYRVSAQARADKKTEREAQLRQSAEVLLIDMTKKDVAKTLGIGRPYLDKILRK